MYAYIKVIFLYTLYSVHFSLLFNAIIVILSLAGLSIWKKKPICAGFAYDMFPKQANTKKIHHNKEVLCIVMFLLICHFLFLFVTD